MARMIDRLEARGSDAEAANIRRELWPLIRFRPEGPALTLFEKRLRDSREPLGLFALANTFGGFLAVCLILSVNAATIVAWTSGQQSIVRSVRNVFWTLILLVIVCLAWCLLLTKSRTAWIGTVAGLAFLVAG